MTPTELAQQIIDHHKVDDFGSWLEQWRPHLTLEVIRAIIDQATEQYLNSAHKALELAKVAQQVANIMVSPEAEALAAWSAGGALHFLCQYQEALACFRTAAAFYSQQGRTDRVVPLQVNQVAVLQNLGRNQEAIELAEATRPLCEALGENGQRILANLEINIGPVYQQVGNLNGALQAYRRAYQLFQVLEDTVQMARTEINQALVLEQQAEFAAATDLILKAKEILTQAGQAQEVARADLNLGVMTYRRGHYQAALRYLEISQQMFTALNNPTEVAVVKLYRSFVYRDLGLARETITLAEEAEQVLRRSQHAWTRAWCLINQAAGYRHLQRFAAAAGLLTKARRILKQLKAPSAIITLDLERAELAIQAGQTMTAQRMAQRLLKQPETENHPYLQAKVHFVLAQTLAHRSVPNEQLIHYHIQKAQELAARYNLAEIAAYTYYLMGITANRQGHIAAARLHLQQAIEQIEALKDNVWLDELRIGFMDDKLPVYQALLTLEHQQARTDSLDLLLHALNQAHTAPWPHFTMLSGAHIVPDEIYQQAQLLRQRWHWLQSRLELPGDLADDALPSWSVSQQTGWHRELQQVEEQLAEILRRRRVRQTSPNIDPCHSQTPRHLPSPQIPALQAALKPGQIFLFYYLLNGECHVLAMTTDKCHHIPHLTTAVVVQRLMQVWEFHIASFTQLQHANSAMLARSYLAHLYNALLRPLDGLLSVCDHLFVVLPAAWQNLPLSAFYDGQNHLIERMALTYLTVPMVLARTKQKPLSAKPQALVLGYSQDGQLPFATQEAEQVTTILSSRWSTNLLTEAEATLTNWRKLSQKSQLIHLATHATFRPDNPFFSWINLADERLTVADLYEMAFPLRPLIVLSACETGRGVPKGGGIMGLARVLFAAGASGLVVSHWHLDDASTDQLMTAFYQRMVEQPDTDTADLLRQAQIACLQQHPHPFFWAGPIFCQG